MTFKILTEAGDALLTEANDNLITEVGVPDVVAQKGGAGSKGKRRRVIYEEDEKPRSPRTREALLALADAPTPPKPKKPKAVQIPLKAKAKQEIPPEDNEEDEVVNWLLAA